MNGADGLMQRSSLRGPFLLPAAMLACLALLRAVLRTLAALPVALAALAAGAARRMVARQRHLRAILEPVGAFRDDGLAAFQAARDLDALGILLAPLHVRQRHRARLRIQH